MLQNTNVLIPVIIAICLLVGATILIFMDKKEEAKKIILSLVVEAEDKFGNGTGSMKYAYVLGKVYPCLPAVVRAFVSEAVLDAMIEEAVIILEKELQPVGIPALIVKPIADPTIEAIAKSVVEVVSSANPVIEAEVAPIFEAIAPVLEEVAPIASVAVESVVEAIAPVAVEMPKISEEEMAKQSIQLIFDLAKKYLTGTVKSI